MNIFALIICITILVIIVAIILKKRKQTQSQINEEVKAPFLETSKSELIKLKAIQHSDLPGKLNEILGENYKDISIITVGGMGVIASAIKKDNGKKVAIKTVLPELEHEEQAVKLFFSECNAIRIMNHPNIVKIFEAGESDVLYYYIMEFLDGENLKNKIQKNGPLTVEQTIKFSTHIARALQHCHDNKIIHRDIKPSNIFITTNDTAKIIDFGIVKLLSSDPTLIKNTTRVGTPDYASPEQLQGLQISGKTDVYSLGACMFNMLTDKTPYKSTDLLGKMLEKPRDIKKYNSSCPEELADIIYKCLESEQEKRFNATQLWYALKDIKL